MPEPLHIGVIGLGFMGATHVAAWQAAASAGYPVNLVAVVDPKASRRAGELWDVGGNAVSEVSAQKRAFDPQRVKGYTTAEELLKDSSIDVVSICTRTDTHVDLAIAALQAGKHVLVEKPLAVESKEVARLTEAARHATKLCMPAMCIRFWPAWRWLKDKIDDGSFGKLQALTIQRLASMPEWNSFYAQGARSGGALIDLHIHDTDFVRFCCGMPQAVDSTGYIGRTGAVDHVTTSYRYKSGPEHVIAEGGWDHAAGFAFRMRYVAVFERATVDYDLGRAQQLLLCQNGRGEAVEVPGISGYDGQVRHLCDAITKGVPLQATMDEALEVAKILEAENRSVQTRTAERVNG